MKTNRIIGATLALLLLASVRTFGVVDQAIQVQGTNLVLSLPSTGNEYYMIQYWPNLQPGTSWIQLTNCFRANSTNRTTYIIPCCTLASYAGSNNSLMAFTGGGGSPSMVAEKSFNASADGTELWAEPADGSGSSVPLAMYPPGYDTSKLTITKKLVVDRIKKSMAANLEKVQSKLALSGVESLGGEANGPQSLTSGGCNCPDMGFFRVWYIPDWGFNVTNFTYSGPTLFPVNFKDYRDNVDNVEVLINGVPSPYTEFTSYVSGGLTNWGVGIYFDRLTNGTYQIQLRTTLGLNEEVGDNAVSLVLSNLTRSIVVFNQVTFPDWNDFMQGDTYTFNAQTANPDTDWSIDIFDAFGNYVNTGSGHTTNGQVSYTWDLNDWQGNNRDDFDSDPYFQSEITFASFGNGPTITKPTPTPVKGFPDRGDWLVSFQDRWYSDASGYPGDLQGKYEDAVLDIYGGPILVGDTSQWQPLKFGTNVYTQADREASWGNLRAWLGDLHIRNFYYHGHGSATSLGCDRHTINTNGLITGGVFSYRGSKSILENWQIAKIAKYKRFRFVYLDGCSTAAGDLPNAFNISKQTNDIAFYENHPKHPRPAVFVGWNQTVGGDETWGNAYNRLKFQGFWMGNWANSSPPVSIVDAFTSANSGASWITPEKLWGALRVYGYQEMKIREYNNKGDWRWP